MSRFIPAREPMTSQQLGRLVDARWTDANRALGARLAGVTLTWDVGTYPHFRNRRGYAVTFNWGDRRHSHLRVAEKIFQASPDRIDGVVRHEMGHVIDFAIYGPELEAWAIQRGFWLPTTAERRADAIAEAIWGTPIRYFDLVQSTQKGVCPRPVQLGL